MPGLWNRGKRWRKREVKEEVGIEIKNIAYFGSQSRPDTDSLLVAFTAEYDKGDIQVEPKEVLHADWYAVEDITQVALSLKFSIARSLNNLFIEKNKQ